MKTSCLGALVLLAGCTTLQPTDDPGADTLAAPGSEVTISDEFNGRAIAVARGGRVTVELASAVGGPYEWVLVAQPTFPSLTSSETVREPQLADGEIVVGGSQINRFVFQSTGSGTGRLRFMLRNFVNNRQVARRWTGAITIR